MATSRTDESIMRPSPLAPKQQRERNYFKRECPSTELTVGPGTIPRLWALRFVPKFIFRCRVGTSGPEACSYEAGPSLLKQS